MTELTLETAVQMTRQAEDVAQQISQQEGQNVQIKNWISLCHESSLLTTFITLVGRYCFKRLPLGISIAPEIFQ